MGLLVKDDNYITIQGFMRDHLGLCGNELVAFAIVYGFSQAPDTEFTGGLQYIADWCGCSYRTAVTVMQSLVAKELVFKKETVKNGGKFCSYRAVCRNFMGGEKFSHGGSEKISHNNIDNYNIQKENNKHCYGEYKHVLLTDEEYQKLNDCYGLVLTEKIIKFLDEYIEEKGYKSKSHYLAIKRWVVDAVNKKKTALQTPQKQSILDRIQNM